MLSYGERVAIAQAAVNKYSGRPFEWGRADCVRLAAFVLREAGRPVSLTKAGAYSTATGALRALKRAGFSTLPEAVSAHGLVEIAPAAAWPGDLMLLPQEGEGTWGGALVVRLTNGRALGFIDGVGAILQPSALVTAWRLG
ncbi:hypothetical protein Q0812_13420 [Brevundimonas sp. 2R-24]|uniref:DUF6950 domain-containing protein n=1 Tax=Peiella sedimenti TaxID=3061083 RepID=A0ABT8SPC7_9CAUL|nr:hypothetical protein [Caulobacteraceae bacterium XZ-24]